MSASGVIPHSLLRRLREVPVLEPLDEDALLRLLGDSANLLWPAGTTVFRIGDDAEGLYLVLSGRVRITDEARETVAEVDPGGYVGEQALLKGRSHSRTVEAVEDSELMAVPASVFAQLLDERPDLEAEIERRLEERLAASAERDAG